MSVTLTELPGGRFSLEFASEDLPAVGAAIREHYGIPAQRELPLCTEYRFAGCSFIFYNEWDDPCLIAESAKGDEILKRLCRVLSANQP